MSGITPKNMKNILQSFGEYLNITYKLKLDSKLEDKETSWEEVVETFMKEKKDLFKEKKTKAKKEKIEGEPKKPTTAFFLFSKDKREEVAEETELKGTELTKELGRRWKEMSDKDKKPYMSEYLKAKKVYEEEMKNFKEENPEAYQEKEKPKKTRKMTGYNVFCKEKRPGVKEENEDMSPKEIMTELGRLWSELDDQEKAEWNAKASEGESGSESEKSGSKKVPKRKTKKASSDEDEEKPKKPKKSKKSDDEEEKPKKSKKSKKSDDQEEDKPKKLETMKVPELKAKAEELGIEDCKTMKKPDLIEAIKSKMEEGENGNKEEKPDEITLEEMGVNHLKKKAAQMGIEEWKNMKKADLIEAIKSKMEEDEEELEDDE